MALTCVCPRVLKLILKHYTKRALAAAMASSESKVSTPSASKVAEGASKVVDSASAVAKDYSDADGLCGEL